MSIATTKVAIDKLVKMYEPLRHAQELLTDLETAEQQLKEVKSQTEGEGNAVKLLIKERDKLTDAVKKLRDNHDATLQLTSDKAAEAVLRAKQDVAEVERAAAETKKKLEAEVNERQSYLRDLEDLISKKLEELAKVQDAISDQRAALRKVAESI